MPKPTSRESIGEWGLPWRGNLRTLPAHEIPSDALYDSENILVRDAQLMLRPGLRRLKESLPDDTSGSPSGAFNYRTFKDEAMILVGSAHAIHAFNGRTWRKLSQAVAVGNNSVAWDGILHGDLDHPSRFTSVEIGEKVYALHANGVDPTMYWDGQDFPGFRPVPGDPVGPEDDPGPPKPCPKFTSITNINDHIIGTVPPYDLRWGNRVSGVDNILSKWPELNFRALADTPDKLVCVEALGTLGAAVYKTDSLWACFFQGGSEASAFRFEFRGYFDGAASPGAVVNVNGVHFYMTLNGRIGQFNGSQHLWIGDGVWMQIRERLHPKYIRRTFGVYDTTFHEVSFYFCRHEDEDGIPRGLVFIALPRPQAGRNVTGAFPGHLAPLWGGGVTCGVSYRLNDLLSKVALFDGSSTKSILIYDDNAECTDDGIPLGEGKDNGEPFDFFWQTGLQSTPDMDIYRLDTIEPFLERNTNFGTLDMRPLRSYALEVPGGDRGPAQTIDLTQRLVRPLVHLDIRGRFHGARYEYTPTQKRSEGGPNSPHIRWYGARQYGHKVE